MKARASEETSLAVAKAMAEGKRVLWQASSGCWPQQCNCPAVERDGLSSFEEAGAAVDVPCGCGSQSIAILIKPYYLDEDGKKVFIASQSVICGAGNKYF